MNAISLWQPWASAITAGLKTIETRSWSAPASAIGKPIAICAAKKDTPELRAWWRDNIRRNGLMLARFKEHGIADWADLPLGVVVCTAVLRGCFSTNAAPPSNLFPCPTDYLLGDFSADRYAWFLGDIVKLEVPVPIVGRQGIFHWEE